MKLHEKIVKLRKEKNLTQQQLAKMVGVHFSHMSRYERGENIPTVPVIKKLAKLFGVSTDYLLLDDNESLASEKIRDKELLEQFEKAVRLDEHDKEVIKSVIEGLLIKKQIHQLTSHK